MMHLQYPRAGEKIRMPHITSTSFMYKPQNFLICFYKTIGVFNNRYY